MTPVGYIPNVRQKIICSFITVLHAMVNALQCSRYHNLYAVGTVTYMHHHIYTVGTASYMQ